MEPKSGWRNWGDHPVVVLITVIASLITIIAFLFSKSGLAAFFATAPTQTLPVSLLTQTAIYTMIVPNAEPLTATPTNMSEPPIITPSPTLALGKGNTLTSPKDGMVMVYVPAGSFQMGSDNGDPNEQPVHTVRLDAFWIDQTDVTNAMYAKCVSAGGCSLPGGTSSATHSDYYVNTQYANYPVINVAWNQAKAYCEWVGSRLPSEAQWEKSARGMDDRTYPWGNDALNNNLLNYQWNVGDTTEVGKYPNGVSPYGVLDMAGNVWQWVADWYDSNYYSNSPSSNPLGPDTGQDRVLRGGSFNNGGDYDRSAFQFWSDPTVISLTYGFRCARSQ